MKSQMTALAAVLVAVGAIPMAAAAQQDKQPPSADDMLAQQMRDPVWKPDYTGESFAWHAAYGISRFLDTYESTGDTTYLDAGVKYYDALLAKMATGPDGYKGWIGPFIYDEKFWCDAHVSDAILFSGMVDFSAKVMRDPRLKAKYAAKAMAYVDAAKKDFFEKWDARGTWHEDGPYGFYDAWNRYGRPGQLKDWKLEPECDKKADCTLPFNKQMDCGAVALRIWQVTGDETYKRRAEMIFGFMKSRMQNYNGAFHWNYEEPAGDWDFAPKKPGASSEYRGWVGVHPERNYQTGEVANIIKAYDAGIVFTEADIKGIVQTNLKVMWNGDEKNPLFANSNADLEGKLGKPESYAGTHAGELWEPLAQFDPQIRKLAGRNWTDPTPPGYARRDVKGDVNIPKTYAQFPMGNVRTVMMAAVMPTVFASGEKVHVVCKLVSQQNLDVALYSADAKTRLATLQKGPANWTVYDTFDGTDPETKKPFAPGNYLVRWTVEGDGYREFPITIKPPK